MVFFRIIAILVLSGVGEVALAGERPSLPYVIYNTCPFECCTYRNWHIVKDINIRKHASINSPIIKHVKEGGLVEALTGNVYVQQLGEITLIPDNELQAMGDTEGLYVTSTGPDFNKIDFKPPYTLFVFSHEGEGEYHVWYRGQFYHAGSEPVSSSVYLKYIAGKGPSFGIWTKEIVNEWWVKVKTPDGVTGWTNEVDHFAGGDQDACS